MDCYVYTQVYQKPMVAQENICISQASSFWLTEELVYHSVPQCLNSVPVVFDDSVPFNPCSSNNHYSGGNQSQPAGNGKLKTRLCANYAKGGSMLCRYGIKCNFVHPTDTEYAALFPETEEFARLKQALQTEVQKLHVLKKMAQTKKEEMELEDLINFKVRKFNLDYPKGPNYHDLHGMTTRGAEEYVLDIISFMKLNQVQTSWIETGRGNHSTNNFPAIRTLLLQHYHGQNGCSFVPLARNDGVLELTVY